MAEFFQKKLKNPILGQFGAFFVQFEANSNFSKISILKTMKRFLKKHRFRRSTINLEDPSHNYWGSKNINIR